MKKMKVDYNETEYNFICLFNVNGLHAESNLLKCYDKDLTALVHTVSPFTVV